MPQADLKYSSDLKLDTRAILAKVEAVIATHDDGAGACKGRAYPTAEFHHTHVHLSIRMLEKPHRDEAFMTALLSDLNQSVKTLIPLKCALAIELGFSSAYYITALHDGGKA